MDLLTLIYPEKCLICGRVLSRGRTGVCQDCYRRMPRVTEPCCQHCGKPLEEIRDSYCADCAGKESRIRQGTAIWVYDDRMKRAIADFKYTGCLEDGQFYAGELLRERADWIRRRGIDCIIPVPLHPRKQRFRGFNQAAILAEVLGTQMKIPVLKDALVRRRYTQPQKGLNDRQRRQNLKCAFEVSESGGKMLSFFHRILLVDDIYTTGSTLEGCAAALQRSCHCTIFSACLCIGRDY